MTASGCSTSSRPSSASNGMSTAGERLSPVRSSCRCGPSITSRSSARRRAASPRISGDAVRTSCGEKWSRCGTSSLTATSGSTSSACGRRSRKTFRRSRNRSARSSPRCPRRSKRADETRDHAWSAPLKDGVTIALDQRADQGAGRLARRFTFPDPLLIQEADPAAVEDIKWKKPSNPGGVPVWEHDGIICTGETYKDNVRLTFLKGALLKDPKRLFNASLKGNALRAIVIREGEKLDERAFKALIRSAVALNTSRSGG